MDTVSRKKRSQMMAGIKSKNTKPELVIRKLLFSAGYRYRLNKSTVGVKPDLVLKKWKLCIFVNGCFWHRHSGCKLASTPKSNEEFWKKKFKQNITRDKKNYNTLKENGWNIGIIWECSIRNRTINIQTLHNKINSMNSWEL